MLRADDYLFPKHLEVTPVNIRKCLFIGSCMAVDYVSNFEKQLPGTKFDHMYFNYVSELPDYSREQVGEYDVQLIQLPFRHVVGDRVIRFDTFAESNEEIVENALNTLHLMLDAALKYNREFGLLTIVQNFIVPQGEFVAGASNVGTETDLRSLARRLNEEIAAIVNTHSNVYMLDAENIASVVGKRYFLDDMIVFATHVAAWSDDWNIPERERLEEVPHIETISPSHKDHFLRAVWRNIEVIYRVAHQMDQVKLVVFDLDDTMWRGIIGEHYGADQEAPLTTGWPLGMHEVVHYLKARGILTAVCSKNSLELVKERWGRAVPHGFMALDDFTFVEIGWGPKAEAIGRIIANASLTPKSVVFVDDNPVERQAVAATFPGIRVLPAHPFETRRVLINAPETQVATVTAETRNRDAMMRQQQKREAARATLSRADFLASLGCKIEMIEIGTTDDPHFSRAFELLNKTNQFNTTGKRWSFEEMAEFLSDGGRLHCFRVSDKYTSYGLVGVALYKDRHFNQFVMSCRVLGLDVEKAVIGRIINAESGASRAEFSAVLIHTEANMPCRSLYETAGFTLGDDGVYRLVVDGGRETPAHIEFLALEAA